MNIVKKYLKPLCCTAGFATLALLAACGGGGQGRDPILGLPAATLTSLAVSPASATIATGAKQVLVATATYSDGSTHDVSTTAAWASATPASATVGASTGLVTGVAPGTAAITATFNGKTANSSLTVTGVALTALAVVPQNLTVQLAATRQLAVIGTYSDASTADVTTTSTFSSATPATASVSNGGLVTGMASGSSIVTASFGGISANTTVTVPAVTLLSIAVTPANASIAVGATRQFVATAQYSDLSNAVINAAWTSSATATATVGASSGLATGVAPGITNISASFGGKSGSAALTVTAVAVPPPVVATLNLRTAANFGVLAGTSITNNSGGTTLVTGDVGSPSQTVDPTQAAGFTNYKSGAILSGALADLQTAITDANGRTCDVSFAGGIDLGGQTFGPGVYCYSGAISITGTLTLNGPGLYIFRTALTLNSTANSIVALNNGASADDVNWVPVGPTTLGANSVFKGNILGQSAAITIGDNTTLLNGRVLTAAAATLRNNKITK